MNAKDLTFGVELETTIPRGVLTVGSYRHGAEAQGLPSGWVAKNDSSIHASRGRVACEFASPILRGEEGIAQLVAAVAKLNEIGARVNASTGLHVHVGWAGDEKALARLVTLVANFEGAIYASTGTKRREEGRWCSGIHRHGNAQRANSESRSNRYHILNLQNLSDGRRNTVEFRAFAGTLNIVKILGYVRLCLGLVERALKAKRITDWTAKTPIATSPIARKGPGQTALTRLFYQLGWIHGRTEYTYGDVSHSTAPDHQRIKRELMRLAKKYDEGQVTRSALHPRHRP